MNSRCGDGCFPRSDAYLIDGIDDVASRVQMLDTGTLMLVCNHHPLIVSLDLKL
jgi:hypothetical protein